MKARISTLLPVNIRFLITSIIHPCKRFALCCSRDSLGSNPKKVIRPIMIDVMEEGVEPRRVKHNP